jgi:hypothetical protein
LTGLAAGSMTMCPAWDTARATTGAGIAVCPAPSRLWRDPSFDLPWCAGEAAGDVMFGGACVAAVGGGPMCRGEEKYSDEIFGAGGIPLMYRGVGVWWWSHLPW